MQVKETKKGQFINLVINTKPSEEAYNEMTNLCISRPDEVPFGQWIKQTEWSVGAMIALFRYQCLQLNGELDWSEFESLYDVCKNLIYPMLELEGSVQ